MLEVVRVSWTSVTLASMRGVRFVVVEPGAGRMGVTTGAEFGCQLGVYSTTSGVFVILVLPVPSALMVKRSLPVSHEGSHSSQLEGHHAPWKTNLVPSGDHAGACSCSESPSVVTFLCSLPSGFMTLRSPLQPTKAILEPSGDQAGSVPHAGVGKGVGCPVPSAFTV